MELVCLSAFMFAVKYWSVSLRLAGVSVPRAGQ